MPRPIRGARRSPNRGLRERAALPDKKVSVRTQGPFMGTMQAGPARSVRAHGLSDEHQDRGLLYVEKQMWHDAIKEFEKAVQFSPDFSEGWNNLGLCYIYLNRIDDAIDALDEAVKNFPGWNVALSNLGLAFQKQKNWEEASNYYKQSLAKVKNHAQLWEAQGECLEALGRHDEALEAYRTAVSQYGDFDLALQRLGMLLARRNEIEEAEQVLRKALQVNPEFVEAASILGAIAARRGDIVEAKELFEQAQAVKGDQVSPSVTRGLANIAAFENGIKGEMKELLAEFDELPSIAECMFNAGLSYISRGDYNMGRTSFQAAADEDDQWAEPRIWLGILEGMDNRPREAREHFEAARKLDPKNGILPEAIGMVCLSMGLNKEANKYFAEARNLGREIAIAGASSDKLPTQLD